VSSSIFINAFLDLPQHVSASHCHHQGVVVSPEATQAVCIVDVSRRRPPPTPPLLLICNTKGCIRYFL
jgi:hypothetical protein